MIAKARRDVDWVQGMPYLRGFSYGDEVGGVGRRRRAATTVGRCSREENMMRPTTRPA